MNHHTILWYDMSYYSTLSRTMLHYLMLHHAMMHYAKLFHDMLCNVILALGDNIWLFDLWMLQIMVLHCQCMTSCVKIMKIRQIVKWHKFLCKHEHSNKSFPDKTPFWITTLQWIDNSKWKRPRIRKHKTATARLH